MSDMRLNEGLSRPIGSPLLLLLLAMVVLVALLLVLLLVAVVVVVVVAYWGGVLSAATSIFPIAHVSFPSNASLSSPARVAGRRTTGRGLLTREEDVDVP
jgi:hypothetical protein